jgi:predicted Zn finger-like uncharacterized protein
MPTTTYGSSPAGADRGKPDEAEGQVILACPRCRTRFLVDEQELNRPAGRTVRCASCGHTWHRAPPLIIRDREPIAPPADPRVVPELTVPPRPVPVPTRASQLRPRRRRAVGWGVLGTILALLALAALAAIIARKEVEAMWPATAPLYAWAGLPAQPAGTGSGLVLAKIAPTRTPEGLVIEGDITNPGGIARDVPRLRVALRDPAEKETQFKIIDPPAARLGPGETAHFKTSFDHPDETATGVFVTFAH